MNTPVLGSVAVAINAFLGDSFGATTKRASGHFSKLGQSIKVIEERSKQLSAFKLQSVAAKAAGKSWLAARQQLNKLSAETHGIIGPTEKWKNSIKQASANSARARQAYLGQTNALKQMRDELGRVGIATKGLAEQERKLQSSLFKLQSRQKSIALSAQNRADRKQHRSELRSQAFGMITLGAAFAALVRPSIQLEQTIAGIGAVTNASKNELESMSKQTRELGAATQYSANQVGGAMKFLGMAGMKTQDILAATPKMLDLATAGALDLEQTADIASNILSGFALEATEMGRVGDVLSKTVTSSNTSLSELGATMKFVAPIAANTASSIEEVSAMAGILGNIGIKGEMAGTALRAMFNSLSAPNSQASKTLDELGIQTKTLAGDLLPVPEILKELAVQTENLGSAEKAATIKSIFGERNLAAALAMMTKAESGELAEYIERIKNSSGALDELAKKMSKTTLVELKKLGSAITDVSISIGSVFLPAIASGAKALAENMLVISSLATKYPTLTKVISGVVVGLVGLKVAAIGVAYTWSLLMGGAAVLTGGIGAIASGIGAAITGIGAFGAAIGGLVAKAFPVLIIGIRTVGLAIMANPLGLILGGIAIAATAIIMNWKTIGPFFSDMWDQITQIFKSNIGWIQTDFLDSINTIKSVLGGAWDAIFGNGEKKKTVKIDPVLGNIPTGIDFTKILPKITPQKLAITPVNPLASAARYDPGKVDPTGAQKPGLHRPPPYTDYILPQPSRKNIKISAPVTINAASGTSSAEIATQVQTALEEIMRKQERRSRLANHD